MKINTAEEAVKEHMSPKKEKVFKLFKNTLGLFLCIFCVGCYATFEYRDTEKLKGLLDANKSLIINEPEDGRYVSKVYKGSGKQTAQELRSAFLKHTSEVTISSSPNKTFLTSEVTAPFDYCVIPLILHWEDRATEWSAKPDRIEIKVTIFDRKAAKEVTSFIFKGTSSYWTLGGDHPQDMLREPLQKLIDLLYSAKD